MVTPRDSNPNCLFTDYVVDSPLVLGDMNELESKFDGDMDAFVSHLIVKLFAKFAKEMSQIGGITLDRDAFADYFRSSNGKQLWVDKLSYIVTHSDGTKERKCERPPRRIDLNHHQSSGLQSCMFITDYIKGPRSMGFRPYLNLSQIISNYLIFAFNVQKHATKCKNMHAKTCKKVQKSAKSANKCKILQKM